MPEAPAKARPKRQVKPAGWLVIVLALGGATYWAYTKVAPYVRSREAQAPKVAVTAPQAPVPAQPTPAPAPPPSTPAPIAPPPQVQANADEPTHLGYRSWPDQN